MPDRDLMPARYMRRFPVYLLLDCSGSMLGEPITAVGEGLEMIYRELMDDPEAIERVHICIIPFADEAEVELLVPIDEFIPPKVVASGRTALGAALAGLAESIETDLFPNVPGGRKGDYRPVVFLLTDGEPTDDYQEGLRRVKALTRLEPTIIALGCGPDVNVDILKELTEKVYLMPTLAAETLRQYFKWISDSVKVNSRAAAVGSGEDDLTLPLPAGIIAESAS